MKPFEDKAHETKRHKMECVTGSAANFESPSDKAQRLCSGGTAAASLMPKKENE